MDYVILLFVHNKIDGGVLGNIWIFVILRMLGLID